jgi:hypothetical protein
MRCRSQKHDVPIRRLSQAAQQLVSLVATLSRRRARVSLIDDHELWARPKELAPSTVALDVVETDDRVGVCREDALARRQSSLQPTRPGRSDSDGVQVKPPLQLAEPLVDEVWRAQDSHPLNVAAIQQLSRDEPCLDRLPDADVVCDQ